MEKRFLKFDEFVNESTEQQIDEGWKEAILAGALALASIKGSKAQTSTDKELLGGGRTSNKEYVTNQEKKSDVVVINFGNEFSSGTYKFNKDNSDSLEKKLRDVAEFIKSHQNSDISVRIVAGESQVNNKDIETGKDLPKGALAQRRAEATKSVISDFLSILSDKGVLNGKFKIDTTTEIGKTAYKPGEDVKQDKFTKEQFVKVTLEAKGNSQSKTADYSSWAKRGERLFVGGHAWGDMYYPTKSSKDIKDPGQLNTQQTNVLIKGINDRTGELTGKQYLVDKDWWNKNVGPSVRLTPANVAYITSHFEVK